MSVFNITVVSFVLASHCYDTAGAMTHSQKENPLMTHAGRGGAPPRSRENLTGCISGQDLVRSYENHTKNRCS